MKLFRLVFLTAAFAWLSAGAAQPAAPVIHFDVSAQSMEQSLTDFAAQANLRIVFLPEAVRGLTSRALKGSFTAEEGIRTLLGKTELKYRFSDERTVVISSDAASSGDRKDVGSQESVAPVAGDAGQMADESKDSFAEAGTKGIPEILVKGARSQNVDIQRTEDDAQPYLVFGKEEIEKSQATTLEDFFKTRLPMNIQAQSNNQLTGTQSSNISAINLRGLGTNQTLILVDGRRAPRLVAFGDNFNQSDINGIPLAAIERIEVLPSTAGGIYGGGAVGGVINIIRKRDYSGIDARAGYEGTFEGGGENFRAELSGGFAFNGGRTRLSFSASHSNTEPLYVGDNDLWIAGRRLFIQNEPSHAAFQGYTTNILGIGELVLDDGTALGSTFTSVPLGYPGVSADNGQALVANAGKYNFDLANDVNGRLAPLRNNPRIRAVNLNLRHSFGRAIDVFLDLTYADNLGRNFYSGAPSGTILEPDAPNNPFQQTIVVAFPITGLERVVSSRSETIGRTAGMVVRLGSDWTASLEYGLSRARFIRDYVRSAVSLQLRNDINNGIIDVVRDLNVYPIDYASYFDESTEQQGPYDTLQHLGSLRLAGSLLSMPAGNVAMTGLVERRVEIAEPESWSDPFGILYTPRRSQTVNSAYAELSVPLFSEKNARPLLQASDLTLSARHDRYTTRAGSPLFVFLGPDDPIPEFGQIEGQLNSTNFTVAGSWTPVAGLMFRGSYSTGFLPPSIAQIVSYRGLQEYPSYSDPRRGGELAGTHNSYVTVSAGNADLQPENSRSYSFGLIAKPSAVPGMRLSVDYTQILKTDEIGGLNEDYILAHENLFPGRVERGPKLADDPADWAGPVTLIDYTLINLAKSKVQVVDLQADYELQTGSGSVRLYTVVTRQFDLERQATPDSRAVNLVDFSDGPLKWRGNVGADWTLGRWDIATNIQYYDSYNIRRAEDAPGAYQEILLGTARVPSQAYVDVSVRYPFEVSDGLLSGVECSVGIQNLLDKKPPALPYPVTGYSPYGDPRLRRFTLSLTKHFGS